MEEEEEECSRDKAGDGIDEVVGTDIDRGGKHQEEEGKDEGYKLQERTRTAKSNSTTVMPT